MLTTKNPPRGDRIIFEGADGQYDVREVSASGEHQTMLRRYRAVGHLLPARSTSRAHPTRHGEPWQPGSTFAILTRLAPRPAAVLGRARADSFSPVR
jgi:hypothetical protein